MPHDEGAFGAGRRIDLAQDRSTVCALFHTGGTTGRPKLVRLTHGNQIHAAFGFARKLLTVKEPAEFFAMQQDFAKDQFQAMQKQVAELNELTVNLAKETVKPVQDGFTKSFADLGKAFAA